MSNCLQLKKLIIALRICTFREDCDTFIKFALFYHNQGWVPVEKDNKQYCWHSSVLDYQQGAALVLRPSVDDQDGLELAAVPLAELLEETLELIGTNVNGNPYGEGGRRGRGLIDCKQSSERVLLLRLK